MLGGALKFYIIEAKGLVLKLRKFWVLILTFEEVTGRILVGSRARFGPPQPWIRLIWPCYGKYWSFHSVNISLQSNFLEIALIAQFEK